MALIKKKFSARQVRTSSASSGASDPPSGSSSTTGSPIAVAAAFPAKPKAMLEPKLKPKQRGSRSRSGPLPTSQPAHPADSDPAATGEVGDGGAQAQGRGQSRSRSQKGGGAAAGQGHSTTPGASSGTTQSYFAPSLLPTRRLVSEPGPATVSRQLPSPVFDSATVPEPRREPKPAAPAPASASASASRYSQPLSGALQPEKTTQPTSKCTSKSGTSKPQPGRKPSLKHSLGQSFGRIFIREAPSPPPSERSTSASANPDSSTSSGTSDTSAGSVRWSRASSRHQTPVSIVVHPPVPLAERPEPLPTVQHLTFSAPTKMVSPVSPSGRHMLSEPEFFSDGDESDTGSIQMSPVLSPSRPHGNGTATVPNIALAPLASPDTNYQAHSARQASAPSVTSHGGFSGENGREPREASSKQASARSSAATINTNSALTEASSLSSEGSINSVPPASIQFRNRSERPQSALMRKSYVDPESWEVQAQAQPEKRNSYVPLKVNRLSGAQFVVERGPSNEPQHPHYHPQQPKFSPSRAQHQDDDILPFASIRNPVVRKQAAAESVLPQIESDIVMSKDNFENYRRSLASLGGLNRSESMMSRVDSVRGGDGDGDDSDYDEDGVYDKRAQDERRKRQTQARQQQNANLSVYRQKMTKMIGGDAPAIQSTTIDAEEDEEDDDIMDDVPLSILRAHGFPKRAAKPAKSKTPGNASPDALSMDGDRASPSGRLTPSWQGQAGTPSPQALRPMQSTDSLNPRLQATRGRIGQASPPPLPSVFGDPNQSVSRGLVAEIAKEEDAKRSRNAGYAPFDRERSRLSLARSALPNSASMASDVSGVAELQQQIQQLQEMNAQIMTHLSGGVPSTPSMMGPPASSAASIRSGRMLRTPASRLSEPMFNGFVPPMSPGVGVSPGAYNRRDSMMSLPLAQSPYGTMTGTRSAPVSPMTTSSTSRLYGPLRPMASRMRMVNTEDDEVDEDAEWAKLIQKRHALREQWQTAA